MSIKHHFVRLAEKITGRKCCRCQYSKSGNCTHPYEDAFPRCWQSLDRPGFLPRVEAPAGALTDEEKHELAKIVETLQEASATAKDAGLLYDTDQETEATRQRRAACWDEKTESGLLEED